jgi:hypothetical protein
VTPRLHILAPEKLARLKRRWWWWVAPLVLLGVISCPTHTHGQAPAWTTAATASQARVSTDSRSCSVARAPAAVEPGA